MSTALERLGELLSAAGQSFSVVVIGGAAMNLLGYVSRTTTDVDLIAFGGDGGSAPIGPPPDPLPEPLLRAARIVARDLGLDPAWLNAGPASQWRTGLPPGLQSRLHWQKFGPLRVGLADRRDLIFLKLYAAADDIGPRSVHFQDLVALSPTGPELEDATAWVAAQDPSLAHTLAQVVAMSSTPASLAAGLIDATVELIWRQWGTLGGSVSAADRVSGHAHAMIDPEALLLGSLCLAERERRLDDVAASWVKTNSTLLSVQRLKNLLHAFPPGTAARLSDAADVAITAKDVRWASIAHPGRDEPLGRGNKLRATEVRFLHSATLMLQLRQGMGVGVKADVLSYLLAIWFNGRSWASTAAITEAIGYTSAGVRRAADDLARARFIDVPNVAGGASSSQRMYSVDPARWVQTLGVGNIEAGWRFWRERFSLVAAILETERQLEGKPVSDYALGVTLRELIDAHRSAFVRNDAVREEVLLDGGDDWAATFSAATMALETWMRNSG